MRGREVGLGWGWGPNAGSGPNTEGLGVPPGRTQPVFARLGLAEGRGAEQSLWGYGQGERLVLRLKFRDHGEHEPRLRQVPGIPAAPGA